MNEVYSVDVCDGESHTGNGREDFFDSCLFCKQAIVLKVEFFDSEVLEDFDFLQYTIDGFESEVSDVSFLGGDVAVGASKRTTARGHDRRVTFVRGEVYAVRRGDLVIEVKGQFIPCRQREFIEIRNEFLLSGFDEFFAFTHADRVEISGGDESVAERSCVYSSGDYSFAFGKARDFKCHIGLWCEVGVDADRIVRGDAFRYLVVSESDTDQAVFLHDTLVESLGGCVEKVGINADFSERSDEVEGSE